MTETELLDYARQMVEQQGDEAGPHLAEAIHALRAIGDIRGARLLSAIARRVDQLDSSPAPSHLHIHARAARRTRQGL
jgi:hypothetical protein